MVNYMLFLPSEGLTPIGVAELQISPSHEMMVLTEVEKIFEEVAKKELSPKLSKLEHKVEDKTEAFQAFSKIDQEIDYQEVVDQLKKLGLSSYIIEEYADKPDKILQLYQKIKEMQEVKNEIIKIVNNQPWSYNFETEKDEDLRIDQYLNLADQYKSIIEKEAEIKKSNKPNFNATDFHKAIGQFAPHQITTISRTITAASECFKLLNEAPTEFQIIPSGANNYYSLDQDLNIITDFDALKEARGAFKAFYSAFKINNLCVVNEKIIGRINNFMPDDIDREKNISDRLQGKSPYIMTKFDYLVRDGIDIALFMQDMMLGDAKALLHKEQPIDIIEGFEQFALGLAAMHEANIVHLDVKPENFLKAKDHHWVVSDFGLSREIPKKKTTTNEGTHVYQPPELVISPAWDSFSLGVTVLRTISKHLDPSKGIENYNTLVNTVLNKKNSSREPELSACSEEQITKVLEHFVNKISESKLNEKDKMRFKNAISVTSQLVTKDPEKRLSCKDAARLFESIRTVI